MAAAVSSLLKGEVNRILLTRPAVEAGEALGFLPGDLQQKILPYLRPLYDALHDMLDAATIEQFIERGVIEVAPLAYMRGRTLNNSFVLLDEAQQGPIGALTHEHAVVAHPAHPHAHAAGGIGEQGDAGRAGGDAGHPAQQPARRIWRPR